MPALADDNLIELAKRYAAKAGVPASLVYAMIMSESTGHPDAVNNRTGAKGLMQLMGPAASEQGFTHEDMANPEKNVEAGAGYLARMLKLFEGDPKRALSAYNVGPGNTRKVDGVAPKAQPYVDTVSGIIDQVTQPGQPFAEELNPEATPVPDALHRQKLAKVLNDLLTQEPVEIPMRDKTRPQTYDEAGIMRMLSALDFNQ